jgi:hypothetical protein
MKEQVTFVYAARVEARNSVLLLKRFLDDLNQSR